MSDPIYIYFIIIIFLPPSEKLRGVKKLGWFTAQLSPLGCQWHPVLLEP